VKRFAFVKEPPSAAKHELSDKGTVNQAIAMENRGDELESLYADVAEKHVLVV
jgi:hypothetical protein